MNFEREHWRKLYVRESVEHRMMSLFARGLRDYLLRLAEPDGTVLPRTEAPAADLARVLNAMPSERRQVDKAVDELFQVGFLAHDAGRLWLPKFTEAQTSRTPEARRQAALRERRNGGVTSNGDSNATSNVTDAQQVTLHKNRSEEKREEKKNPPKPSHGEGGVLLVFECWQRERKRPNAKLDRRRIARIKARFAEGFTVDQLCEAIKNAKNDTFLMGDNDRSRVFDGIETLLRDTEQVERLIALKTPQPKRGEEPPGYVQHRRFHEETRTTDYKTLHVPGLEALAAKRVPPRPAQKPKLSAEQIDAAIAVTPGPENEAAKADREERERLKRERDELLFAQELEAAKGKAS